ncbi:MAG: ABC transporter permease [Pseudohongiella sp.]|nr:ABC transporter permease [Pseudohongiella sp.]MDP2125888.1 ABC transporter permease [Pseudohongiella sp.]
MFVKLAVSSLVHRRLAVILTVFSIMFSTFVVLGAEHIRHETRNSFSKTVSGADLIVGARTSQVNLLLYSIFRIGNATNNISWSSYQQIVSTPGIAWSIPLSLGDSHRGYRVMGTTSDYFRHFRYGNNQALQIIDGVEFSDHPSHHAGADSHAGHDHAGLSAVLGADVAARLGYHTGRDFTLAHGLASISFSHHDDHPFTVVGILAPTGTPVDQTIHVSLESLEAVHHGGPTPEAITAFLIGLESRQDTFGVQREINEYRPEPLLAIMPGVALTELWQMMGLLERVLALIAGLVLVCALLGMTTMLLSTLQQREREIAVLRALGARPLFLFALIQAEAFLMTAAGLALGLMLLAVAIMLGNDWISAEYGLFLSANVLNEHTFPYLTAVLVLTAMLACLPAAMTYRRSLALRLGT